MTKTKGMALDGIDLDEVDAYELLRVDTRVRRRGHKGKH